MHSKKLIATAAALLFPPGEALPAHIGMAWKKRFNLDIVNGVSSSSMGHLFLTNLPGEVEYGTSGVPVDGYKLRLIDENGNDVGDGEIGEFGKRQIGRCWLLEPARKIAPNLHRQFNTDSNEYLRRPDSISFCGRADDMFKVSGVWVSPFEVRGSLDEPSDGRRGCRRYRRRFRRSDQTQAFIVLIQGDEQETGRELCEELDSTSSGRLVPGSIHAGSNSSIVCPRPRPGNFSATYCVMRSLRSNGGGH